jgi:nucleoside phosphorylase
MCGVCAGRRGKVELGDVVAADRVFYHDTGKQRPGQVQQDLKTYNLRDSWKAALEGMDPVARFRDEAWFQTRPLTTEWRLHRALVALYNDATEPWQAVDPALGGADEWPKIVAALRERKFLASAGRALTKAGRRFVEDLQFRHQGALPALSPDGALQPFRLHVAPIGSGARVIEDERIWTFVSKAMRRTLGIEMEAAAIGELAHRQRQHQLDWVVMKGVMDFADHGRDDHFKEFAARASAECLLWFLRERVPTEVAAGFDDLLSPGTLPLPARVPAPSVLLNARYAVVPWHEAGRSEVALRLLYAEGGVGKTRLAIEWVSRRRGRYDIAGFLAPVLDNRWLERLCGRGASVIIIIDYAESRADLEAVLFRVAAFAEATTGPRCRVRVLLLARSDGDWWKALLQRHLAIAALQGREPLKLLSLAATPIDREAVFAEALEAFAARRGGPAALSSQIGLDGTRFERVLYLHMAALAAVEGVAAEMPPGTTTSTAKSASDASSLMDEILAHEERFWTCQATDRSGAMMDLALARQLVAAATLRGGVATKQEARELCERLEGRPRDREDDALLGLLHEIYDVAERDCYLSGLEPDLLGEGIVLRVAAPPPGAGDPAGDRWIDRVVVAGDDAHAVLSAFTVLGRASATNPAAVRLWIEAPKRACRACSAGAAGRQGRRTTKRFLEPRRRTC